MQSTGFRRAGSLIVAHGPSCSAACGIFPDQGSNPCPLHWQADSQPLRHQGSPYRPLFTYLTLDNLLKFPKLHFLLPRVGRQPRKQCTYSVMHNMRDVLIIKKCPFRLMNIIMMMIFRQDEVGPLLVNHNALLKDNI